VLNCFGLIRLSDVRIKHQKGKIPKTLFMHFGIPHVVVHHYYAGNIIEIVHLEKKPIFVSGTASAHNITNLPSFNLPSFVVHYRSHKAHLRYTSLLLMD
jgi:hypothetical protein